MSKIVEYKIVFGEFGNNVARSVQTLLDKKDEEWELYGYPTARKLGLYQAMVRREPSVGFSKRTYRGSREDE